MVGFLSTLLYIVFVLSAILLIVVILLQEPKGGGLAEAFGGVGAETFGVRERGINKFTATVAGVFLGSAVLIHVVGGAPEKSSFRPAAPPPGSTGQTPPPPNQPPRDPPPASKPGG